MIRVAAILIFAIAALFMAALSVGDRPIPVASVIGAISAALDVEATDRIIVRKVRLPRAVLAVLVGAALGAAGAIVQSVMRNPLAEPGILGINAGAALAALVVIVEIDDPARHLLPLSAFAGALIMAGAIYGLAYRRGTSSIRLILIGIGLSALAGAGTGFISAFGDVAAVQQAQVWLAGSLYRANWQDIETLAIWLAVPFAVTLLVSRELDVLAFGEDISHSLGQRVQLTTALMLLVTSVLSAAAVAAAGLLGFVGLIAPHVARRLVGRRNRAVIPIAALAGAALVLGADLAGRVLIAPATLPAGLMTTLLGAPFFAYLLWKRRNA